MTDVFFAESASLMAKRSDEFCQLNAFLSGRFARLGKRVAIRLYAIFCAIREASKRSRRAILAALKGLLQSVDGVFVSALLSPAMLQSSAIRR